MATTFAFLGMLLMSMLVALLAALQLGDLFLVADELAPMIGAVAGFTVVSLAAFAAIHVLTRKPGPVTAVALALAVLAVAPAVLPGLIGPERLPIALALVVPAWLAVLVQWGLVRQRMMRATGQSDLTRWPWYTTFTAALAVLNPYGLSFIQSTFRHSATELSWELTASITAGGLCALLLAAWVEYYVRDRILNRRVAEPPRDRAPDPYLQEAHDAR
jgi:hypothetical protein